MEPLISRAYHENGIIASETTEVDGLLHGVTRHWHPNGVLALEIPVNNGLIDGVVKQWNDSGELLGTSELKAGTGVHRGWYPNGVLQIELPYVGGSWTGCRRIYEETGELIEETYWLENKKVSKKRYFEACKQNPNLPRYDQTPSTPGKARASRASDPKIGFGKVDELPRRLLDGRHVREALDWLEESREPSRTLGEAVSQEDSMTLVKKLYKLGALAVHAVEIDGDAGEDQNTGRLVIELPPDKRAREKVLRFCGVIARELGFDPEPDLGQRYVLLMLD